jgi:hypothetical protein
MWRKKASNVDWYQVQCCLCHLSRHNETFIHCAEMLRHRYFVARPGLEVSKHLLSKGPEVWGARSRIHDKYGKAIEGNL